MFIDGTQIAQELYNAMKQEIQQLKTKPKLCVVLVGDNKESLRYIAQKKKWAEYVGMNFELCVFSEDITEKELVNQIQQLNQDSTVDGYIVQLPLPKHISEQKVIESVDPQKDVDGFHPINQGKIVIGDTSGFTPCTPAGVMKVLEYQHIELRGKIVCIIGRSNIVGKPLANLCTNAGATVFHCNSATPELESITQQADIVMIATGQAHMLTSSMLKKNTTVIDIGFTVKNGKIYGDADTQSIEKSGHAITPVPGGVGPLTVAMLISNTLKAFLQKYKKNFGQNNKI